MKEKVILLLALLAFSGCDKTEHPKASTTKQQKDISSLKEDFIAKSFKGNTKESPYELNYSLKTVFYSPEIISLLEETNLYDSSTGDKEFFQGKTFYKSNDKFIEAKLSDLFNTNTQKEFLTKTIANSVKKGNGTLCEPLDQNYDQSFLLNDSSLILILQPTEKCEDRPHFIGIDYNKLKEEWNPSSPLARLLPEALQSKSYTTNWDEEEFIIEQ